MRSLSRVALLGALSAVAVAPSAMAAPSLSMSVSPNKRGTLTVGAPTSFNVNFASPERISTTDGSLRLKAITTKLPDGLVFNPIPFTPCNVAKFIASKTCPSGSKLGTATIIADGGPEITAPINATATLYFGTGYAVLARVQASAPAVIDEAVVGSLQSSATAIDSSLGYGLQLAIPVTPAIQVPLDNVYPTVKSFKATIKPLTSKQTVAGLKGKTTIPLVGLGPCKKLNFQVGVTYTNAAGLDTTASDVASDSQTCKK